MFVTRHLPKTHISLPIYRKRFVYRAFFVTLGIALFSLMTTACAIPPIEKTSSVGDASIEEESNISVPDPQILVNIPRKNIYFGNISVDQGLSQSSVFSILQDSIGLMWFGTEDGLNKFDGYEFTIYKHDPENANSLSNNTILDILEDRQGLLWIGTIDGLNRYDRETNIWEYFPLDRVRTIIEDQTGELWVGSNAGLYTFEDGESKGLVRKRSESTFALVEDSEGILWVGTDRGLIGLDQNRDKIAHFQHQSKDDSSLANNLVRSVYEDSKGNLWIGTNDGLDKFDRKTENFRHYKHDDNDNASISHDIVRVIFEDLSGDLWIGTDGGGISRFDPSANRFVHYQNSIDSPNSLSSNFVQSIYQDRGGMLWIGTIAGGLNTIDVTQKKFDHFAYEGAGQNGLSNNFATSIFEDYSQVLWVGTGGGGLNRIDRQLDLYTHYRHDPADPGSLSDDFVTSIFVDRNGDLWAGTNSGGLNTFDRFSDSFKHYVHNPDDSHSIANDSISSILEDRSGLLWIGTLGGGLDSFDRTDQQFTHHYGLSSKFINTIFEDQDGEIWVGTNGGGLNRYDRMNLVYQQYTHDPYNPQSISSDNVMAIFQDQQGIYWIGTAGGGLNKFDPETETFVHYREKDGLPNDVVYGILEDEEGFLWVSTNNGLSKFDPKTEIFRNFDVLDGLQSNEFNRNAYFKNTRGEMFFGGVNGFTAVLPNEIQDDQYLPPVVMTSFTQSGGDVALDNAVESIEKATFYWPNNFFEFEFAALSYSQSEKNQYAYMLDGFRGEEWNYIGPKRFGRYTNLPGGTYTLRLKGSNKDGVWNEAGKSIEITVVPPFWMTWWFQGTVLLILIAGVFTGYQVRVRNIQSRTEQLEDQVTSRTKELEALNAIASVVGQTLELQKTLEDALDKILEVLAIEAGGIYLLDDPSKTLTIEVHRGLNQEFVEGIDHLKVGEGISGQVVADGEIIVIPDISNDPRLTRSIVKVEQFHAMVVLPLISRGKILGTMFLITREFRQFEDKDLELLAAIGAQIGGAIENAKFFEEEHHRSEQFRVLAEVGHRVGMELNENEVLEEVVSLVRSTFGYYHIAIGLVEGDEVVYRVGKGELWEDPEFGFKPARLKIGMEGLSGWVAATGQPIVVPDVSKEPRYVWMHGSQTRSETTVPILVKGRVIGVLDAQSDQLNAFDETDLAVLQSLAHQAGAAIENARLYEQAQQAAVLEERARLARELHDAVTQTLFSASLLAEALPVSWENDRLEGEKLLEELKQLNRGALAEMRTLLIELRPSALIEASFGDLLQQLAEAASGREGLPIEVEVACDCSLPPDVHIALYRITQEALNNIVKHARANNVSVQVSCSNCGTEETSSAEPKEITLVVRDNGRGFDQSQIQADQLGLDIMRERAEDIGARLKIESDIGDGTMIEVIWQNGSLPI
jgi:ligand-binding sensor domain-containing protein/nitrate/nitrite-specific signal transduction histidine kinase